MCQEGVLYGILGRIYWEFLIKDMENRVIPLLNSSLYYWNLRENINNIDYGIEWVIPGVLFIYPNHTSLKIWSFHLYWKCVKKRGSFLEVLGGYWWFLINHIEERVFHNIKIDILISLSWVTFLYHKKGIPENCMLKSFLEVCQEGGGSFTGVLGTHLGFLTTHGGQGHSLHLESSCQTQRMIS